MPYLLYLLASTSFTWTSASTTGLHCTLKFLQLTMKDFKLSMEYPILIFNFSSRLVEEADNIDMSERQNTICQPEMLKKTVAREYCSTSSGKRVGRFSR